MVMAASDCPCLIYQELFGCDRSLKQVWHDPDNQALQGETRKAQRYDATVDLLEHRYPGGRFAVRQALAAAFKPKLRAAGATTTHRALLALARHRKRTVRLVTTNFDRVFESREAKQECHRIDLAEIREK
jgi:hypothetical protein